MPITQEEIDALAAAIKKTKEIGSTIRAFVRDPDTQAPIHIEIVSATPGAALTNLESLRKHLKEKGYVPHEGFAGKSGGGSGHSRPPAKSGQTCPMCKGDMWDNRAKKKSGEYKEGSSDFTCKNNTDHKFNVEDGKLVKHWSMTRDEHPPEEPEDLPFE